MSGVEVEFRVLGAVQLWIGRKSIHIGPPLRRTILAILLVEANRLISSDRLVDAVWGERPPTAARDVLASHIARLRQAIAASGARVPRGSAGGYRLEVKSDLVDLHRFRELLRRSHAAQVPHDAGALTRRALDLWHGEPFTGTVGPWLEQVRASLTRQWLAACLDQAEREVRQGRAHLVVDELLEMAAQFPLDERLLATLMVALSDTGRRADALLCFEHARRRLADELGVDPSEAMQATHRAIINGRPPAVSGAPQHVSAELAAVVRESVRAELHAVCGVLTRYLAKPGP